MQSWIEKKFAQLQAWINSKGGFSHVIAVLFAGGIAAYAGVPAFHDLALKVYNALPSTVEESIIAVIGLYAWYHHASSPAGTLARARSITSNGNAPTAAEVDAADVAIK